MFSIMKFFVSQHKPKLNISITEQRKRWLRDFLKTFFVVFIVYMAMYLIRNNFKASSGLLKDQLGFTTLQLGQIGFVFSITYGIGKTLLGYFADGYNTKRIISVLLILSAIVIIIMGVVLSIYQQSIGFLLLLWGLNGLFQSVGGPLSYATIFKWVPKKQRGRWMGTWNASHNVGGAVAGIFSLWGANLLFSGHVAGMFIFPAVIALIIGIATLFIGHDSPEELGLERAEVLFDEKISHEDLHATQLSKWKIFVQYVLGNKWIWLLCVANIFVYIVRIGIDNWAPLYTKETLGFDSMQQVNTIFYFEIGALIASITWGYVSDLLGGRRCFVAIFCLTATAVAMMGYRYGTSSFMINSSLFILGSLIFGPQLLIGVSVTCFVPRKAVTVTNGITGTFGYLFGDSIAKIGLAMIADPKSVGLDFFGHVFHGWQDTFDIFYGALICGIIVLGLVAYAEEQRIKRSC
jgi:MFS transporter, OPA family, hexose phosphate transport protein UhpT